MPPCLAEPGPNRARHLRRRPALEQNERDEAAAFDRLADRLDRGTLKTSERTFARYRSAVAGRPIYHAYPDRAFHYIGRHYFHGDHRRPLAGVKVLDLGAGDGVWSVILAEQGAEVTSIEISPRLVDRARERMRLNDLAWDARVASAYRLRDQFSAASFGLIYGRGILHHLTCDLQRVYDGMHHLLREGGHAAISEPYCASGRLRRLRERVSWIVPLNRESPDERPLDDADLSPLVTLFKEVTLERYDLLAKFGRRIFRSAATERALFRCDRYLLEKRAFRHLAGGVFIALRK